MPHDNRITIRLAPHQIRRIHRILRALVERRGHACLLGLSSDDVEAARDLLERIPNIVPQQSAIRNQYSNNHAHTYFLLRRQAKPPALPAPHAAAASGVHRSVFRWRKPHSSKHGVHVKHRAKDEIIVWNYTEPQAFQTSLI